MPQRMIWVFLVGFLLLLWLMIAFWAFQGAEEKKKSDEMPPFDFKHDFPMPDEP
jgi:hypothetical protein